MKLIVFKSIVVSLLLLFFSISYCQIEKRLEVNISPKEINKDSFNGQINMFITNISKDTVYIVIEPFNYEIVNWKGLGNYITLKRTKYSPNRVVFFRSDINTSHMEGWISISFLRFPKILFLPPGENCEFTFNVDKGTILELRDSSWVVSKDIWCAVKSCVDNVIMNKDLNIIEEFEESLISKDKIDINLTTYKQTNPSIYLYKDIDSCYESEKCYTVYDSIILKSFINYCY